MAFRDQPDFTVPTLGPISKESRWEWRSTLYNHGDVEGYHLAVGHDYRGKFYPRGCRGHITTIDLYCRDAGAAGGTIDVYITPVIGMGHFYTASVTVPPGGAPAWRSATFNVPWNYDSLFIWYVTDTANMLVAYDTGQPRDAHQTSDAGVTWTPESRRYHIRAVYNAETPGDVPVSGTINVIPIPSTASRKKVGATSIPPLSEVTLNRFEGAGRHLVTYFWADRNMTAIRIYVDDAQVMNDTPASFQIQGRGNATPEISLLRYDDAELQYWVQVNIKYEFRRIFEVHAHNIDGAAAHGARAITHVNLNR